MGIYGTKMIKKEEQKNNSWSMDMKTYEQFQKDADKFFDAFFGDIMKQTESIEKKRG